jgi:hypothetical protein
MHQAVTSWTPAKEPGSVQEAAVTLSTLRAICAFASSRYAATPAMAYPNEEPGQKAQVSKLLLQLVNHLLLLLREWVPLVCRLPACLQDAGKAMTIRLARQVSCYGPNTSGRCLNIPTPMLLEWAWCILKVGMHSAHTRFHS